MQSASTAFCFAFLDLGMEVVTGPFRRRLLALSRKRDGGLGSVVFFGTPRYNLDVGNKL